MSYQEALEALKKGKYKDVITWFDGLAPSQRDGKTYALAALAHFNSSNTAWRRNNTTGRVKPAARTASAATGGR